MFDTGIVELIKPVISDQSNYEWKGDGKLVITMRKENAPSYWKNVLKDASREAKELNHWWEMREKYIEELEEYMLDEKDKEDL